MYRTCILDGKWSFWHSLLWSFSYFLKLFWSCIVSKSPTFRNSIMSGICSPSRPAMDPMPAVHSSQVHSLMMSLCLAQAPRAPQMAFASKKTGYTAKPPTAQWTVRTASHHQPWDRGQLSAPQPGGPGSPPSATSLRAWLERNLIIPYPYCLLLWLNGHCLWVISVRQM